VNNNIPENTEKKANRNQLFVCSLGLIAACLALPVTILAHDDDAKEVETLQAKAIAAVEAKQYPTHVIADYVLGCMAANGNSFESLHQCSCSIDHIMSKIKYEDFEKASTIMQVQLDKGQRGIFYRDSNWAKHGIEKFERVQAESTLKCF